MDLAQPDFWAMDKNDDAYRTISEAAEELDLPQHVLRFWETRFPQIKPMKRGGGRRYYRPEDLALLRAIRHFLYGEGYTIKGVQRLLNEQGPRQLAALAAGGEYAGQDGGQEAGDAEPRARHELPVEGGAAVRPVLTATRDLPTTRESPRLPAQALQPAQDFPPVRPHDYALAQGAYQRGGYPQGSYLAKADLLALESALAELEACKRLLGSVQS